MNNSLANIYLKWIPEERILNKYWSSELSKLVANALACRISSINLLQHYAKRQELKYLKLLKLLELIKELGKDFRIRPDLEEGFQKDILSLVYICNYYGLVEVANYWEQILLINKWQQKEYQKS